MHYAHINTNIDKHTLDDTREFLLLLLSNKIAKKKIQFKHFHFPFGAGLVLDGVYLIHQQREK